MTDIHNQPLDVAKNSIKGMTAEQAFTLLKGRATDPAGQKYGRTLAELMVFPTYKNDENLADQAPWTIDEIATLWPRVQSICLQYTTDPVGRYDVFYRPDPRWQDQDQKAHTMDDIMAAIVTHGAPIFVSHTYFLNDEPPPGLTAECSDEQLNVGIEWALLCRIGTICTSQT